MVVDVVFPGWIPFKGLAVSQDIPGWVHAQDVAMSYPWQTLVAGHLGRLGTRADVDLQRQYVADLTASARATIWMRPRSKRPPPLKPGTPARSLVQMCSLSTVRMRCSSRCGSMRACSARSASTRSVHGPAAPL
jgi:hypothetical protein